MKTQSVRNCRLFGLFSLLNLTLLSAHGATNFVTTLQDSGSGSLRNVLAQSLPGDSVIIQSNGTITLTTGELMVTKNVTIIGPGPTNLAISGNYSSRVFSINSNIAVRIYGVTIRDGKSADGTKGVGQNPPIPGSPGGGVYNAGALTMLNCGLLSNTTGFGGWSESYMTIGANGGDGAGLFNIGTLTASNCTFSLNTTGIGGGGGGSGGSGAGLCNRGVCLLNTCALSYNRTGDGDDGWPYLFFSGNGGLGAGIYNLGTLAVTNCILTGNHTGRGGNHTYNLEGNGGEGGGVYNAGTLLMYNSTISSNSTGAGGVGVIWGDNGTDGGNGGNGAGVCNTNWFTAVNCTMSSNRTGDGGLGGDNWGLGGRGGDGGDGGNGGGFFNAGTLVLTNCTINGNSTGKGGDGGPSSVDWNGGNGGSGGSGGGLYGSVVLANCTVTRNGTGSGGAGGQAQLPGVPGIPGSSGNGGGLSGSGQVLNTLVASNTAAGSGPDVSGNFTSLGHNLVGNALGGTGFGVSGDLLNVTPQIGPLTNNGGITWTCALLPGSPAINAGDDAVLATSLTDQRGFPRRSGTHVDIGAFELDLGPGSPPSVTTLGVTVGAADPVNASVRLTFSGAVNPNGTSTGAAFEYGLTANYGGATTWLALGNGTNSISLSRFVNGFAAGFTYHYRLVATNQLGSVAGADRMVTVPSPYLRGDFDGDGVVSQSELDSVLTNYWPTSPWVFMTNVVGLGGTNVTFGLSNAPSGPFTVQYSTNLMDWQVLGPAVPRYLFTDTNAPISPMRYYRLRIP